MYWRARNAKKKVGEQVPRSVTDVKEGSSDQNMMSQATQASHASLDANTNTSKDGEYGASLRLDVDSDLEDSSDDESLQDDRNLNLSAANAQGSLDDDKPLVTRVPKVYGNPSRSGEIKGKSSANPTPSLQEEGDSAVEDDDILDTSEVNVRKEAQYTLSYLRSKDTSENTKKRGSFHVPDSSPVDAKKPKVSRVGKAEDVSVLRRELSEVRNICDSLKQGTQRDSEISMLRREIGEVRNMCGGLMSTFESVLDDRISKSDAIIELLLIEVKELRAIDSLRKGGRRGREEIGKGTEAEVPFFNYVFSEEVSRVVLERCTVQHVMDLITKSSDTSLTVAARRAAAAVRILMFAVNLKKGDGRSMYKTELGQQFSEFREGIVLTALNAAKNNIFNLFRQPNTTTAYETSCIKTNKPSIPKWLTNNFVTSEDISSARIKLEETSNKNTDLKFSQRSSNDTRYDEDRKLGVAAAHLLYSHVTKTLTSARTTAKICIFDEVGYLFVDWRALGASADQGTLKVSWLNPEATAKYENLDDVPTTMKRYNGEKETGSGDESLTSINRQNKKLLQDMMADCKDMVMRVEHEVCIRKHAKSATEKNGSLGGSRLKIENSCPESASDSFRSQESVATTEFEKTDYLVRDVNLIDIGCRLLSSYTFQAQYASSAPFLSSSSDSLKCVYTVSLFLRRLLEKVINSFGKNGLNEQKLLEDINVNGINLKSLLPTPSSQKSGVQTKTVHMFQHVFNARSNTQQHRTGRNSDQTLPIQVEGQVSLHPRPTRNPRVVNIN